MSQFQENLWTDRWMDKRTDEQTLFYSTLPAEAGGPIIPTFFKPVMEIKKFHDVRKSRDL